MGQGKSVLATAREPLNCEELGRLQCRICLEEGNATDLIAPCTCKGFSKWVHRGCLDQWRAMKQNPRSFTHCSECAFEYRVELKRVDDDNRCCSRRSKFRAYVARDVLGLFFVTQLLILIFAGLTYSMDSGKTLNRE